jgi:hypothetical protein
MVKLNIELTMAELISKIVRSAQKIDIKDYDTNLTSRSETQGDKYFVESDVALDASAEQYKGEGIMKTVTMLKDSSCASSDGGTSMA